MADAFADPSALAASAEIESAPGQAPVTAARMVGAVRVYQTSEAAEYTALRGVTLSLTAGCVTAIVGPSGSGKSTLLNCLAGLDRLTSGQVFIGAVDLATLDDTALTLLRRERIGMIFQSYNLIPGFDAEENILLPLVVARREPDAAWFTQVVDLLSIGDRLHHQPAELSGGEQQRVAAARALITKPALIVADEPTGNLDRRNGTELLGILRRSVDELGQTVVLVTHDPLAAGIADRAVALVDGMITGDIERPTADEVVALANAASERGALGRSRRD